VNGLAAIFLKEFAHIRREPTTIFFVFVVPVLQMTIFGFAIKVTIDNIPLIVHDLDGRQESRRLVEALCNTRAFKVVDRVNDLESYRRAFTSGRAKAGVLIPADYSDRLVQREQATVQILVDGSDSQVATTAMNTATLLVSQVSLGRARAVGESLQFGPARDDRGGIAPPVEARVRLLFNPNLESAHFFVPGLIGIILQLVALFLTSFSVVREREVGTLEQLFVTPVGRAGLLLGKLAPYSLLAMAELLIVLLAMTTVFGVPIRGSLWLLLSLSSLFVVTVLGLGLLISTMARTQLEAIQFSFLIMLPSVFLSGFMFPRSEMPAVIHAISYLLPVTYFMEILRGVILRGADASDLLPEILGLTISCAAILGLSLRRFRKQLD
jgi:ABC transporter DrrB family efflux protein